jgi:1-acyl-sn-glycerol-3-phosphate acyltransferase
MLLLRSFAFNTFFYLNISIWMIAILPTLLLERSVLWRSIYAWSRFNLTGLKYLAAIRVEVRGLENLPQTPVIVAAKHQSAFETIALLHLFQRPAFILKQELMRIPLFGWYATKTGMIPVDRKAGQRALRSMVASATRVLADGRQIIIFPEGTRRVPGAEAAYKHGIVGLYKALRVPVVPVALNSGLFWPRKGMLRFPGTIVVEFFPPIEPGLSGDVFFARMTETIERGSDDLLIVASQAVPPPPLSSEARSRIAEVTNM